MYLRAMTNNAIPTMITARLEAPPVQPWNFSSIISEFKLASVVDVGVSEAVLQVAEGMNPNRCRLLLLFLHLLDLQEVGTPNPPEVNAA